MREIALQHLVKFRSGQDYKDVAADGGSVPVIGSGGPFATASAYLYDGESVLFGRKGTIDRPMHVNGKFWTVDTMFYTELGPLVHGRWLYYWATTLPFGLYSTDTALPSMTSSTLGRLKLPFIPKEQQRCIADYLDRETGEIDTMIAKMDELAGRLEERRQTTISDTVLGIDREFKVSTNNTWIPSIPAGWRIAPIQLVTTKITDGAHVSPETDGGLYDFVSTKDVRKGRIDFEGSLKTSEASYNQLVKNACRPADGDILYSKDGTIGETAIVRGNPEFVVASSLIIVTPDQSRMDVGFLDYALRSVPARLAAVSFTRGSGLPRLSISNFSRGVFVPVPPTLDEQKHIAEYLDEVTSRIDTMLAKVAELKSLLIERRAALITDVVTGRKEVA